MAETLKFGFDNSRISLDVPQSVFDKSLDKGEYLRRILEFPARQRVVTATPVEDGMHVVLNTKRAGNIQDRLVKHDRCRQLVTAVEEIATHTPEDLQDPNLRVEIGTSPISGSNRYGFNATLRRPHTSTNVVQHIATEAMQRTAADLKYMPKSILASSVYAVIDLESYVSLETNPMGSCSLDSDGMEYEPDSPTIKLYAHNLYSHEMQLICFSGLVAIANL